MQLTEMAVTHGYAVATVPGHAAKRDHWWRTRLGVAAPAATGHVNVAGWQRLAGVFEQMGAPVVHGGSRLVN